MAFALIERRLLSHVGTPTVTPCSENVEFKSPGGDWLRRLLDLFCLTFISNSYWEELTPFLPLSPISALYSELVCCSAFAADMLCFTFLDFPKEFC